MRRVDHAFAITGQALLVCYFLFICSAWFSHREKFQIKEVRIEGVHAVDPAGIESIITSQLAHRLLWRIDRNNAVLYPKRGMRSAIMQSDAHVKEVGFVVEGGRLTVRLNEYSPEFLWCPPGSLSATTTDAVGCSFADVTGHIFAPAPEYSGNPFLIFATTPESANAKGENTRTVLSDEEFGKVNAFLSRLVALSLFPRIVLESGVHDFTIVTDKPWVIRWSSARDPEADTRNLALVLQNLNGDHMDLDSLTAIDLRFGNKVFYR